MSTDTLEITANLDSVLAEASRVLKPGSVLLYDTVTPSVLSRLIYLGALQSWRWTRIAPPGRYAWERFREPGQLSEALAQHGLRSQDVRGFQPAGVMRLLRATLRARRGQIDDDAGLAMRFPRFTGRWRDDKGAQDATTTAELVSLFLTARHAGK